MAIEQTTPQDGEVETGMTEAEAASELLKRWGDRDEANDADSTDADDDGDEPRGEQSDVDDDDADTDPDAADDGDAADESGDIEIDVNGEKFKLPKALSEQAQRIQAKAKEVEAGATRKFKEAADLRKAAETTAQQAVQQQSFNQAQAQLLGDHALVTRRMQLIEQMDTTKLEDSQLTRLNAEYNQLQAAKGRIETAHSRAQEMFAKDQDALKTQRYQAAEEFAKANIKDWATDGGKRHATYAASRGIGPDDLEALAMQNPRLLLVLDDAEYGARIRNAKPAHEKRLASAPKKTIRPGAGGQASSTAAAQADQLTTKVKKTGRLDDAVSALLARSKAQQGRRR